MYSFLKMPNDFLIEYKNNVVHKPTNHFHECMELVYFEKADVTVFIKDRRLHLQDGDLLFIQAFEVHRYMYNSEANYVRCVITFKKELIAPILKTVNRTDLFEMLEQAGALCLRLNARDRQTVQWRLQLLLEKQKKQLSDPGETSLAAIRLELSQLLLCLMEQTASPNPQPSMQEARISRVVQYIDAHYEDEITLESLQQVVYLNKYRIAHLFKEITGFTVTEYIQHRRVIEAQKKLLYTKDSVTDIAIQCGFNSIQNFCRVFRKFSHISPAQYRRQHMLPKTQ